MENIYEKEILDTSPLMMALKEVGLEFLVPEKISGFDRDRTDEYLTETDPVEYEPFRNDILDEDDEDDRWEYVEEYTLDNMMLMFGYDYLDIDEFLTRIMPWDLFGITKNQFMLIDTSWINWENIDEFKTLLQKKDDLSIEQKIKYAIVASTTDCHQLVYHKVNMLTGNYDGLDFESGNIVIKHAKHLALILPIGKAIATISTYKDYIEFHPYGIEMNRRRAATNRQNPDENAPIFDYTLTPKPSHIRDLHNKAFRDYQTIDNEIATTKLEALNDAIKDAEEDPDYRRFLWSDGKFTLVSPKNYDDFKREGDMLNHCIASYAARFGRMESYIYFLRRIDDITTPFYSIEVVPSKRTNRYRMDQCYTFGDSVDKDDATREFIVKWCKKFKIRINCEI